MSKVSRRLGKDRTWLSKRIRSARAPDLDLVEDVLRAIGASREKFWGLYLAQSGVRKPLVEILESQSPGALLRAIREERRVESELLETLAAENYPYPLAGEVFELEARADEIDDLRETQPVFALADAEHWVRETHWRHRRKQLSSRETVQLATSLGVWGSALRGRGRLHLASQALQLALELHGEATASPTYADLLERAAAVSKAFGYLEPAVTLLQRAIGIFSAMGDQRRRAKSTMALATINVYQQNYGLAERIFFDILHDPAADPIRKAGSAINLAALYEQQGEIEKAEIALDEIASLRDRLPETWSCQLIGIRACLAAHREEWERAAELLRPCVRIARQSLPPERSFMAFLDLAAILVQLGRGSELLEEASIQSELLGRLENTPLAQEVASSYLESILAGRAIEAEAIETARSRFAEATKRDHKARDAF